MRVAFDARPGSACATGIGRFARSISSLLGSGLSGHDCFALGEAAVLEARSPLEDELELPAFFEREAIDCYHSPLFRLPALLPTRSIITIHDAIPAVRPDLTNPDFARLFEEAPHAARRADAVVCPSEHVKKDLVAHLGVASDRVHVVPECPAPLFQEVGDDERARVRRDHQLEAEFLFVVGSIEPRKNPGVVLDVLQRLPGVSAVFVGPEAGYDLDGEARKRGVSGRARKLGLVDDRDLAALYNEALALVFPSRAEGFGLPLVEAFACGTPVISSNATSLPEVAGDAALFFDPDDAVALADAIRRVLGSPELRDDLRNRGKKRLELYSEDAVRKSLAELYTKLEGRRV